MNAITPALADAVFDDVAERAIYEAAARLERCVTLHTALGRAIAGTLPLPQAEALMDGFEDHHAITGVALKRALAVFEAAIGRIEDIAITTRTGEAA